MNSTTINHSVFANHDHVLTASDDWNLYLLDLTTGLCLREFEGHSGEAGTGERTRVVQDSNNDADNAPCLG